MNIQNTDSKAMRLYLPGKQLFHKIFFKGGTGIGYVNIDMSFLYVTLDCNSTKL